MCAGSKPPLIEITSSQQFYMHFRNAPTMEDRKDLVLRYPDTSRETFYNHIVRMATDLSFKDLSPIEYKRAVMMGRLLVNLYAEVHGDTQLKDTYERMRRDLEE